MGGFGSLVKARLWEPKVLTSQSALSNDLPHDLVQMLSLYFPLCKNGFMDSQQPTFPRVFTNMQSGNFSCLLLT